MRVNNLSTEQKEKFKRDITFLGEVLEAELGSILLDLVTYPLEKVPELQGRAKAISEIIKLL